MTPEQIKEHEDIQKKVESGNLREDDLSKVGQDVDDNKEEEEEDEGADDRETVQSLPPPPPSTVTWEEYINAPEGQ